MAGESLVTPVVALMTLLIVCSLFVAARRSYVMLAWVAAGLIGVGGLFELLLGGIPVYTHFCRALCGYGWVVDPMFYFTAVCIACWAAIGARRGTLTRGIAAPTAFMGCFLVLQAGILRWFS